VGGCDRQSCQSFLLCLFASMAKICSHPIPIVSETQRISYASSTSLDLSALWGLLLGEVLDDTQKSANAIGECITG
jgi:hypothetical protein